MMRSEFEITMIGELNFSLRLQIKQTPKGTFINQEKYIRDLQKKYQMMEAKPIDTPMGTSSKLDADKPGPKVNKTMHRGIIGSLSYLTTSRSNIVFSM